MSKCPSLAPKLPFRQARQTAPINPINGDILSHGADRYSKSLSTPCSRQPVGIDSSWQRSWNIFAVPDLKRDLQKFLKPLEMTQNISLRESDPAESYSSLLTCPHHSPCSRGIWSPSSSSPLLFTEKETEAPEIKRLLKVTGWVCIKVMGEIEWLERGGSGTRQAWVEILLCILRAGWSYRPKC